MKKYALCYEEKNAKGTTVHDTYHSKGAARKKAYYLKKKAQYKDCMFFIGEYTEFGLSSVDRLLWLNGYKKLIKKALENKNRYRVLNYGRKYLP